MQVIQAQGFGQRLLREGLFGKHGGDAVGAFLALRRVHVTSSTNWLSSVMVSVLEMVPPISVAWTLPANTKSAPRNAAKFFMSLSFPVEFSLGMRKLYT
jgi:hypothetical protein